MRSPRLLLETQADDRLLQVRVVQARTTLFGPRLQEIGTWFFPRIDPAR